MIRDPFNPKFVFTAPVVSDEPMVSYVERAIVAWNRENGIDAASVTVTHDAAVEILGTCLGDSVRVDLWVEELEDKACVYGFTCSSEDGVVPYARGEETVTSRGAWSAAFRHTHEMLMKDLPAFA